MKRRTFAVLIVVVGISIAAIAVFAPVVYLEANIPGTGGLSTATTTQGNTTSTITLAASPGYGQGFGSITFCFFGQGGLLIHGAYYPLTKPTLQIEGAFCPATSPH